MSQSIHTNKQKNIPLGASHLDPIRRVPPIIWSCMLIFRTMTNMVILLLIWHYETLYFCMSHWIQNQTKTGFCICHYFVVISVSCMPYHRDGESNFISYKIQSLKKNLYIVYRSRVQATTTDLWFYPLVFFLHSLVLMQTGKFDLITCNISGCFIDFSYFAFNMHLM